jgi:hypothetical protein
VVNVYLMLQMRQRAPPSPKAGYRGPSNLLLPSTPHHVFNVYSYETAGRCRKGEMRQARFRFSLVFANVVSVRSRCPHRPTSTSTKSAIARLQGEPTLVDSLGHLFSIFKDRRGGKQDGRRWQQDADGILVFVSFHLTAHVSPLVKW